MKDIIFDPYPDVQYYGAFVILDEKEDVFRLTEFVREELLDETSLYIEPCDPWHVTIAHRQARGPPSVHKWVDENMGKEVELTVKELIYNNKIAILACDGPFETSRGGEKHITVRLAHGVKQTEAFNLLRDPKRYEAEIPKEISRIKARVDAWSFA